MADTDLIEELVMLVMDRGIDVTIDHRRGVVTLFRNGSVVGFFVVDTVAASKKEAA